MSRFGELVASIEPDGKVNLPKYLWIADNISAGSFLNKERTVTTFVVEDYSKNEVTLLHLQAASVTTLAAFLYSFEIKGERMNVYAWIKSNK